MDTVVICGCFGWVRLSVSGLEMHHASGKNWAMSQRRFLTRTSLVTRRAALMGLWLCLIPLFVLAETGPFRFAWHSDTHVGSGTGEQDLRASVSDINSLTGLSFVVHSGDVTEYGSREQLRLAKDLLSGIKIPTHVIPGNHDTKWSESGATDLGRLWKEDRFVFRSEERRVGKECRSR